GSLLAKARCQTCGHEATYHSILQNLEGPPTQSAAPSQPTALGTRQDTLQILRINTPNWCKKSPFYKRSYCPRTETVAKLVGFLEEKRVLHIRATPSSGKTTLGYLMKAYLQDKHPNASVILTDGFHLLPTAGLDRISDLLRRN